MEIEFQHTKKDYTDYYRNHFKNFFQKRIVFVVVAPLLIGFTFGEHPFVWWNFFFFFFSALLILLGLVFYIPYLNVIRRLNKEILEEKGALEKKRIITTEDGLIIESESKTTIWKWENIHSYNSNKHSIIVILADKKIFLLPKRYFQSDNDVLDFMGVIQNGIIKVRGGLKTPTTRTVKISNDPPYLLGLLGFIPILGAVVGIGLIIAGTLKYKDKWLIIVGAAGVLLGVGSYFYIVQELKEITHNDTSIKEFSQMRLNTLVKDIEFYKLQYGAYPDSLEQISNNDSSTYIYDPILQFNGDSGNNKYNYNKVNDRYCLFSAGIDMIPDTDDDIYPSVALSASSRFGFIKKQ